MNTELKEGCSSSSPCAFTTVSFDKFAIISRERFSLTRDQISITLLYFSPAVTRPDWNCWLISDTSASAASMMPAFVGGITISLIPIDTPDFIA